MTFKGAVKTIDIMLASKEVKIIETSESCPKKFSLWTFCIPNIPKKINLPILADTWETIKPLYKPRIPSVLKISCNPETIPRY